MNSFEYYGPSNGRSKKLAAGFIAIAVVAVIAIVAFKSDSISSTTSKLFSKTEERFTAEDLEFMKFITEHRRFYFSKEEYAHRFQIFKKNLEFYAFSNSNPENTFTLGVNMFSDLTEEEYSYNYLNSVTPKIEGDLHVYDPNLELAATVNWTSMGVVTPVKDQGHCGSCWAFSATGGVEGVYTLAGYNLTSFSEQQIVDCCGAAYGSYGCDGGEENGAYRYIQRYGLFQETQYPYTATDNVCNYGGLLATTNTTGFTNGYKVVAAQDNDALAQAVNLNPVSVALDASSTYFHGYSAGVMNNPACGTTLNHAVLVTGYGNLGGLDYWLVKNSWGTTWGEAGYIRIGKQNGRGKGICGIALAPSYPFITRKP